MHSSVAAVVIATMAMADESTATKLGASSPQELVARLRGAAKLDEGEALREVVACLDSKWRVRLVSTLLIAASLGSKAAMSTSSSATAGTAASTVAGTSQRQLYEELLAKHGLAKSLSADLEAKSILDAAPKALAEADQPTLARDLLLFAAKTSGGITGKLAAPAASLPEVTDYQVSGEVGTARAGTEMIFFMREDGRWLLTLPAESKQ